MNVITALGLNFIRPELYLSGAALALLLYGAYKAPKASSGLVLVSVLILALTGYLVYATGPANVLLFSGMLVLNAYTLVAKLIILMASALALLLATDWLKQGGGRPFEYAVLVLTSTLGMMLMVSSGSLLALYMSLELMSLSLYVLASFDRDHPRSSEAGLKYFVLGSLASGMTLFGISLVYGFAGTINFEGLAMLFSQTGEISRAVIVGMIMIVVGFCFKISAAPFHMWAPDVYEGAPTPVTAYFSTAPKVAAMLLFVRVLVEPFAPLTPQWQQVIIAMAILSMAVGSFAAIVQTNIKRLLAYSSIGHVGFVLLGMSTASPLGVQSVVIYLILYVFMSIGMFGCILMLKRQGQEVLEIKDLTGLAKTNPAIAATIAAFMFSMAGIPPLSGFFAKFFVLYAAVNAGLVWLVVVGLILSVVAAYYYLKIVKIMYLDEPVIAFTEASSPLVVIATTAGAAVTLLFFLLPTPIINLASAAAKALVR